MVHLAAAYARQRNRLGAFACTTSVGPGATNMVTGAALATINRLPVLLLPGDTFATRAPHPVLQQLEAPHDATLSVNDCFRPVSRYFDRIDAARAAGDRRARGDAGADRPGRDRRGHAGAAGGRADRGVRGARRRSSSRACGPCTGGRRRPRRSPARRSWCGRRRRPLIVAGGGVIYSEATDALAAFADATGIPVAETQAGRGALRSDHPLVARRDRRDRHGGGQPARARGRPGDRRRHALERLHDRLAVGVPGPGRALRERQRGGLRRRQAERPGRGGRRAARPGGAAGRAGRPSRRPDVVGARGRGVARRGPAEVDAAGDGGPRSRCRARPR